MKRRMNTKKLVYIGLLAAVATALMYLEHLSGRRFCLCRLS